MTARTAALLLVLVLPTASCGGTGQPADAVRTAVDRARTGDLDGFLECFTPESAPLLGMFWSVSNRYGYLDEDSLRYLADVEILGQETDDDRARVDVRTAGRQGTLCLALADGSWRIDLLAAEDCTSQISARSQLQIDSVARDGRLPEVGGYSLQAPSREVSE